MPLLSGYLLNFLLEDKLYKCQYRLRLRLSGCSAFLIISISGFLELPMLAQTMVEEAFALSFIDLHSMASLILTKAFSILFKCYFKDLSAGCRRSLFYVCHQ